MFGNDISQVAAQAKEFERSGKRDKFLEESANAVYDDGEGRQLFPVEIDPAMDRYLRQKGEGWQADAWNSYQRGKMLAADLRKGGDDPLRAEKMRVLGEERERLKNYFVARKRRGLPFFTDVLRFQAGVNEDAAAERRKDKEVWHRSVFCGDLKKIPEGLKKRFAERKLPDGEIGDEMRYRSIVFGWALNEGGYAKWQVEAGNGVPVLEQMCIRLKEQGEQVDFNKPGQTVYMFLSRQAQKDAQADELLKGAAESVRQAVLTGGDGRQALWEQRGQMGEDMYKKVGNTLRWVKADAERTRRGLEPVLPRVMEGLEWAVKYADGTANRIFQPEGMASIHQALKAMDGLTDAQMDALAEIVQRKGGNERSYMANVWKAGNRGWEDLGNGIRSLLRGGIAAQLDVAGGVKELFGGDGSALKADAKAADEYGRRLDAFLAMAQGTYRPINKPEYGWFGNGVLSAVRSVPITALSFSGVGAGVAAMSYAGDSYSKAVQERPDGGRLARLGGAAASGAVQGALDRAGAIVAKGVMGLRSGSAFVDKWMSKLSLSRQAMRLKSSALRAGARSGVAGGMVLGEEMTTEKLQDLADPVMQSLASVMAGEAPGIDWERFWKDFTNRDQNMELFGSVLAFALVGAGARFTAEAGMQRQLSREYGKLKRTFGFSDSLLARMRAEESDVARYAMMQDGIQDFMRQNYGKEVDGVKVGLGDADGMRKLAARGGVRTMDVVAAAEAHAAETARGVDEVRVDGAEVQEGKGAVVGVKGPESGGVSEVGSGPVLSFEHGPVPERKGGRQVDEKEAMKQYVEAVNEQLREFGASPIREEMNEFTEEMQYVVELGDRPEFYDTYDDAYEAVLRHLEEREDEVVAGLKSSLRQYRDKDEGYVGRVQDEANEEMMQHLSDVGQDGRMSFDRSKLSVPMTLAQLKTQGDFMRKSAEGRERIYAAQMGVEAGVDAARLRVYGANVAQEFANGRYEVVSRLYRGANPFDVYEEWTEGMTKVLIKDNEWTVAEFEDELKRLEGATGETFLATGEGVDRLQAVCEGVSKAARAHLMGHISDERLPDKLRRWFKMFALLFAKYFEFAQDVMLAKKMLGADVQGKMSEKFRRLLNDFAGFDEAAIAERARREEQAQIEAEAMGDVPEIGEWVAGRLPHPKTAAEAGSDLTGELQRIYDALTTTRTAKGRRRKDGTLGKSFEQRVVARAEQFFSREGRVSDVLEAANEAGFDFADSGELLSAVYDSVVYGYKRYAARGEGQEVSFSMGDRVRRVPMAEARRVADAFHRVEGMEPVAADVPAAYASDLKDALGDIRERYRVLQKETQEQGYALVMGDGKRVQVGGKGWREVKQHAADRRVLAALAVLPELAGRAEFIYSGENSDLKRKPNIARFHYYLTKADFKGASDDGSADLAYVNIAVAEGKNGELFYDLDASTVEDVDSMKGTSATLQRPRVPNTGEAGDGVPHKGRVALLKEFVNYVDRDLAGQGREGREVSVQDVEAQGGFDEHGVLAAENAVVVKPDGDVTMSVRALHASPHSFRKFDTAFMGKGEGAQAYGWGLYFAENPKVNRSYLNQFAQDKATWRFRELEASNVDDMARGLRDRIVFPEHVNRFEPGVLDAVYSVLGDLSDARGDKGKIEAIKEELREDIRINEGYSDQYPQAKRQADAENIAYQYLLDHLDEIEVRTGMPSNYRVELNVEDYLDFMEGGELLFWDKGYGSSTTSRIGDWLLDEGKEEAYSLFNDKDPENGYWMGGKIYRSLEDALGSPREASEFLLRHGVKGIRYADGFSRWKAEEKQTYNYVIFDGNDIKITAFADESTGGAWADYVDGSATFSIREKASIKKKAVADGTFMKAPNGANTNLTEDQWLSVRTEAFKNWFGDWEHDPENASKVVDENGEPRVVYHGSGAKFNTFSHKFAMKNGAVKGRGFYFTDDQGYAEGFAPKGGHLFKVFLNLRNPFDAEKLSLSKKDVERVIEHLDPDGDLIVSDYASSANGYPGKAWYRKALKETVDAIVDSSVNDADIISELYTIGGQEAALRAVAETLGRDGFMSRGPVNMQIVFSSTQIKSATDNRGTYDPKNPDITFSMRMMRGGQSVWDYLAGVQGHAFEQEARLYEAMQKRLESALQANGFTRDGVYKDEQGRDDEAVRERMLAVMAVCDAVVTELPKDVRGGIRPEVVASYREEVMAKKTWRGRMNALMRMVKYVDWHIVNEGKKSRFKEFERFRKWAAASVGENRVRRGKMNAEIQKRLDMVERALELDADELETAKNTAEKVVEEKALIGGAEYDEAVEWVRALDAFGGLYERNMHGRLTADLERVQAALDALKEMYSAGRLANEAFWEDRRERIADLLDEAGKGLGREQPVSVNERTGAAKHDVGVGKGMRNLVRGFVSFENLMEDLFGEGKVTEYFAEGIRKARLEFNDVRQRRVLRYYGALYRIARPEEFLKRADRKVDGQVKLGVRRVVDGMLKDLSENRTWGIEVKMPGEFRSERVRIEEALAVAEGKMEAEQMPKWAKNQKAMDALKMALSEIPAKSRKEFVKFSWLEQGAELVEMEMSDLEAAYLLQMSAMPEYEDNLEALGFDEAAIGKVRDHIDVRALRVAEYLGEEYERGYKEYNEVYRRLFGCDMPKVQNYAPGFFVTDNAAEAVDPMESRGSGWLSVGSIKMRRKHYALPRVVSCVNAYWAHSMQMDHWASFAEIMRDMKAVLLNGELGNKIDAVHGAQARTHLTKWVKDLEFDGSQDSGGAGQAQQVVSRVLGAMAQGALSYNLKTCLKQLPAMFSSMADMSPSDAMKGFIGALANPGQLAEVWMSPTIQQRLMQGMSPEMRQALTANRMKVSMLGDAVEAGMLPIGLTDAAFTTFSGGIAYMAAKKIAMKEGLSDEVVEQRALAALDKAVRRTAQPIETEQKSPWEIHANALGRMFMMFRSDPRKQIALSYMAIAKWKRGEIGMGEAAWRFGQAWVVYGIMNQVIVEFLKWVMGQGDDEEELDLWDRWKGFAVSGAMGAFSGIFGLAEVIEFIYSKLAGEKYMKFSNTMVDHAEALWRGGEGVVRMYNGEEEEYGKVMNQLGRGLNGMGLFAAAGRPEIGAAVQVMGRIVKETKSMAGTWGHLWDNEMAKAREQQRLIQATKKEEKEARKAKMEERKELMARVKGLDLASRLRVYQEAGLDKDERKLMENRVKMDGASEVVKAVSRVKKDKRKELVEKLKGTMSDVEYEEFVTELKEKGVKWK
ncbi:hypothetical protein CXT99_01550 [Akkermansia muciniphila]|uniref:ADP-ribosyltransferase-containing protein n=1 Tax=Akkermansia muciniphila TaxID=239935 RepID=UPI000C9B5EB9|nr:hypothetical protein [Akkermansia muciniphila]PNC67630.1 hypothetical protein CXU00_02475 [Akkermansia muciniphila]PNC68496.1 hypothetical protein CXT99_01550 [Akkermansia muciniphila]